MDLLDRIKSLCADRGVSLRQVEQGCGLARRYIYKWDHVAPSVDKVAAVADYFGVTVDELLGRDAPQISAEERRILDLFRQLNEEGRDAALAQLEFLATRPAYIKSDTAAAEEVAG